MRDLSASSRRKRPPSRVLSPLAALAACLIVAASAPAAAGAATTVTLGRLAPKNASTGGCAACTDFQLAAAPGTSYTVPPGSWTLTSWSGEGGATGGAVSLRVFRPAGAPGLFTILATSESENFGVGELATFPVTIPVKPGDAIGIVTGATGGYPNLEAGSPGDDAAYVFGGPSTGQTVGPGGSYGYGETERYVNVVATLTADTAPLRVTMSGAGSGTVTSGPAGISCAAICSASFELGDVLLAATPAPGSTFAGWSGGGCSGTGPCPLNLTGPAVVDARFDPVASVPVPSAPPAPSPSAPAAGCVVPTLVGKSLAVARRRLRGADCALGAVSRPKRAKGGGVVVSQHPSQGTGHPAGAKVGVRVGAPGH